MGRAIKPGSSPLLVSGVNRDIAFDDFFSSI